jgi:hypothetical protein
LKHTYTISKLDSTLGQSFLLLDVLSCIHAAMLSLLLNNYAEQALLLVQLSCSDLYTVAASIPSSYLSTLVPINMY